MSKKSEAKARQGYDPKPVQPVCANCTYRLSELGYHTSPFGHPSVEVKGDRCGIGNFKVKAHATCDLFEVAL